MKRMIRFEMYKMIHSRMVYIAMILYDILWIITNAVLINIDPNYDQIFTYGYQVIAGTIRFIFHDVVAGHLLASGFVGEEYDSGTFGLAILSGRPRRLIMTSKMIVFLLFNLIVSSIYMIGTVLVFSVHFGGFWSETNPDNVLRLFLTLFFGVAASVTTGTVVFMFSIMIKKKIWSIGAGIFLTYLLGQLDNAHRDDPIPAIEYNYVYQIRHLSWEIDTVGVLRYLALTLLTVLIAYFTTIYVFDRKEFK